MTPPAPTLVSVDVGGTLGQAQGPSLAARLVEASPLGARQARRLMRDLLHVAPVITDAVVEQVCEALHIETSSFPRDLPPTPLRLYPGTTTALREMSQDATVVTLSNVTCAEADPERLLTLLGPWVSTHFPSCQIGYAKPDRRAFLTVVRQYGLLPADVLHVGDDWECDVVGATEAGLRAMWISHGRPVPDRQLLVERHVLVAPNLTEAAVKIRRLVWRTS